ncbi:hypothetical protein CHUAL_001323 [Chamberlinius hualienensis]
MKTLPILIFVFSALLLANLVVYTVADDDDSDEDFAAADDIAAQMNQLEDAPQPQELFENDQEVRDYDDMNVNDQQLRDESSEEFEQNQLRNEDDGDDDDGDDDNNNLEKRRWVYVCDPDSCVKKCLDLIKSPIGQCGNGGKCYCKRAKKPKSS